MAKKTKLMATAFQIALKQQEASKIQEHFTTFKKHLTYDITDDPKIFCNVLILSKVHRNPFDVFI